MASQKCKKLTRVYNTRHACLFCGVLIQHLPAHLKARHKKRLESSLLHGKSKNRYDELRIAGDDKHNKTVIEKGEGELLLARRPVKTFIAAEHGPCPYCFQWMHQDSMKLHQKQHVATPVSPPTPAVYTSKATSDKGETKKSLLVKSDILAGRFHRSKPTPELLLNVYPIMTRDAVSAVAKSDQLIVAIGDSWYRRSRGNPKAKYYSSQHMRLMARLLMHLRDLVQQRALDSSENTATRKLSFLPDLEEQNCQEKDVPGVSSERHSPDLEEQNCQEKDVSGVSSQNRSAELDSAELIAQEKIVSDDVTNSSQCRSPEEVKNVKSLWEFIVPQRFDDVVAATLQCAMPDMDDTEELASPTNAIRLKYDILRLVDCKWAMIQTAERGSPSKEANACDVFHRLVKIYWGEHVTKLARTVLLNRSFIKEKEIPSPDDMRKLTVHVVQQLKELKLTKTTETFRHAVQLSQARLLIYNKRRSGEIDNIT